MSTDFMEAHRARPPCSPSLRCTNTHTQDIIVSHFQPMLLFSDGVSAFSLGFHRIIRTLGVSFGRNRPLDVAKCTHHCCHTHNEVCKKCAISLVLDPERDYLGYPWMALKSGRDPKLFRRSAGTPPSWHVVFQGCLAPHRRVPV